MASFLIISQNPVLAELIRRNLAKREHSADVRIVGQLEPDGLPMLLPDRKDAVIILDLDWFDARLKGHYQVLAWLCQRLPGPRVVLADESWSHRWLQRFSPTLLLAKPFSMGSLISLLKGPPFIRVAPGSRSRLLADGPGAPQAMPDARQGDFGVL